MATGWDGAYRGGKPPWDVGGPQPVVVATEAAGGFRGRILDAGCGTGENTLFLVERGHEVLGIDWSAVAIERARAKAADRRLPAEFEVADALHLEALGRSFDSVLDCGLFHTLGDPERVAYVAALERVVVRGGVFHLLCFSRREPWGGGPRRISRGEIHEAFGNGWSVEAIEPARFATLLREEGAHAWHATIVRR